MFQNSPFLIIGGTSKAGTTSVFTYLADHPQICASSLKEIRFFLDADYPVPVKTPFNPDLKGYDQFFNHCKSQNDKTYLEASPDYLYSNTALQIGELLPQAKLIFLVREPIDRMVSWYKYAKQKSLLDSQVTFEQYIQQQLDEPVTPETPVHLRALDQGHYKKYLERFIQIMPGRVLVLSYRQLSENPQALMQQICNFASIDSSYFQTYAFTVQNKSKKVKFAALDLTYKYIRNSITDIVIHIPWLLRLFRLINAPIKRLLNLNYQTADTVIVTPEIHAQLSSFYAEDLQYLKELNIKKL